MSKRIPLLLFTLLCICTVNAQPRTDPLLSHLFAANSDSLFQEVIQNPKTYRLQIVYTEINRNKRNQPSFKNHYFHIDSTFYFNPASTVKFPLALLALEKINDLHIAGLNKYTTVQIDSAYSKQTTAWADSTSETGKPSVAHYIKKAFLVSDNDAYNRLYEFVGQQGINRSLRAKGYRNTRITHRFVRMNAEENRRTNPMRFIDTSGQTIHTQPPAYNSDAFDFSRKIQLGKGYLNADDSLIKEPFDFTMRNNLPLTTLQQMMQSVVFPLSVPTRQRFRLTDEDYAFLYQYLSQFPGETNHPKYDDKPYYDSYVKFFFRDTVKRRLPDGVRVFNKVGWAYGFLTDVSYVADFNNKVEYMLAATLYVNRDEILNDNRYEYESVGWPFLYQLGQTVYRHELSRKRKHRPNLNRFKVNYEKRLNDNRPVVDNVEN